MGNRRGKDPARASVEKALDGRANGRTAGAAKRTTRTAFEDIGGFGEEPRARSTERNRGHRAQTASALAKGTKANERGNRKPTRPRDARRTRTSERSRTIVRGVRTEEGDSNETRLRRKGKPISSGCSAHRHREHQPGITGRNRETGQQLRPHRAPDRDRPESKPEVEGRYHSSAARMGAGEDSGAREKRS